MQRYPLCHNGIEVSAFIAGFWRQSQWGFSDKDLHAYVEGLLELGISTMDHASVYQSEAQFGRVLASAPQLRDKMEIISKFGIRLPGSSSRSAARVSYYDSSAQCVMESVERSLSDLHTDHLDLLLVHRPDYLMHVHELAKAFESLIEQGKIRYVGVSNFSPSQCELLQSACPMPLVTNQVEFSPLCLGPLDNGVLDQCQHAGRRPLFWSCLAGGRILTADDKLSQRIRQTARVIADELGAASIEAVIYAWVMAVPCGGIPLLGSSKLSRIEQAMEAQNLSLSREQWYRLLESAKGKPVP